MRTFGIGLDDMFQYDMLARSIMAGNGYRWYAETDLLPIQSVVHLDLVNVNYDPRGVLTSFRPPFYPAFLALIYFFGGVEGYRFYIVRVVQAVLAAFLPILTFALARRLFPNQPRAGVFAAWVITLYPILIIYPLALATENLFFVLVLSSILVLLVATGKSTWQWYAFAGVLLGLTALTRSVSLAFAGLTVLWVWFVLGKRKMAIMLFVVICLVTLPWIIRNTVLHHHLTGIESALGYNLYVGYYPNGTGTFEYPQSLDLLPMLDDGQRDVIGRQKALEFIKADPNRFLYLAIRRAGYFFGLERRGLTYFYSNNFFGHISDGLLLMMAAILCLPFVFVCTSGVFGLALSRWSKEILLIVLFFIGYVTPHLFILAEDRFHLAIVPFLAIFGAYFWTRGRDAIMEQWHTCFGKSAIIGALVCVMLMLVNWGLELLRDAGKLALLFGPNGNLTYFPY